MKMLFAFFFVCCLSVFSLSTFNLLALFEIGFWIEIIIEEKMEKFLNESPFLRLIKKVMLERNIYLLQNSFFYSGLLPVFGSEGPK